MIEPTPVDNAHTHEGWIAPNGDFYCCDYGWHSDTAEEIIRARYPEQDPEQRSTGLHSLRFVHLSGGWVDMGESWDCVRLKRPTSAQVQTLWDIYMRFNVSSIKEFIEKRT